MNNLYQPSDFSNENDASNDALISSQLNALYASLNPQHIEQFYQGYSAWQMHQKIALLEAHLAQTDQQINDNAVLMQLVQPSTLSLVALTHLQSYGVDDINLLDTMLARGEEWLDHIMQLLTRCERMNLIHESYTEWCRHALEGAYDWLDSINETSSTTLAISTQPDTVQDTPATTGEETAKLLLRKLLSDDESVKVSSPTVSEPLNNVNEVEDIQEIQQEEIALSEPGVSSTEAVIAPSDEQATSVQEEPEDSTQADSAQKIPGHGLLSRVLAKVWNVS